MATNVNKRRKVLIVSFLFPPANTIGAVRVGKFAKYLPEFGWEPIVLTADIVREYPQTLPVEIDEANIFRTPYFSPVFSVYSNISGSKSAISSSSSKSYGCRNLLRSVVRLGSPFYNLTILRPVLWDPVGWYPRAVRKGRELLERFEIDAIFSSYMPSTSHFVASRLQRERGLPWVADFRDPWALNVNYIGPGFLQYLEKRLEKYLLKSSSLIVTVSPIWAEQLQSLHNRKVAIIHNGFDHADYMEDVPQTDKFTITYTGRIYPKKQDPLPFFKAVKELREESSISIDDFEIRFFGSNVIDVLYPLISEYGLEGLVNLYNTIPYSESIRMQKESSLLLLLKNNDPSEKGWHGGKIFEYLGAGRPVLAVGTNPDVVNELLSESGSGLVLDTPDTIKSRILQWYKEFKQSGTIISDFNPNAKVIPQYTRRNQAGMLAQLLDKVSDTERY